MAKNTLLTAALWFGVGLGFAPSLPTAHACSCVDAASWRLELAQVTGPGDTSVEVEFWPTEASLSDDPDGANLYLGNDRASLGLERAR